MSQGENLNDRGISWEILTLPASNCSKLNRPSNFCRREGPGRYGLHRRKYWGRNPTITRRVSPAGEQTSTETGGRNASNERGTKKENLVPYRRKGFRTKNPAPDAVIWEKGHKQKLGRRAQEKANQMGSGLKNEWNRKNQFDRTKGKRKIQCFKETHHFGAVNDRRKTGIS